MYKIIEKKKGEMDRTFPLKGIVLEIGRASSCDISLADNNKASRIHARLEKDSDGWWLVDLNSTNGTFVNKEKIKSKKLESGDEIAIGESSLMFLIDKGDEISNSDTSTEFEQPRLNVRIQDEDEAKRWSQRLFIIVSAFLLMSISVWIFYSLYINMMSKIHRIAAVINNNTQRIDLIYGDIETSEKIILNLGLIKDNMPAIIDFMAKVQDNPRIFDVIKKDAPDLTIESVKKHSDDIIEFGEQTGSYKKTLQQVIDTTESFKRTQDRRTYKALVKEYAFTINEMERVSGLFLHHSEELSRLNSLLISFDKASSRLVPSLSRNTVIIIDASNKIKDDILRLINNIKIEKAFLLSVKE